MTNHRGRTWDSVRCILPDGAETKAYLDTTWGRYAYFVMNGHWRKVSLDAMHGREWLFDLRD